MEIKTIISSKIARITSNNILIQDTPSLMDFVLTIQDKTNYSKLIIDKNMISENFFDLKTGLLGEAFQKLITYNIKLAIVGDFLVYDSKSLKDYIYESNQGNDIFFVVSDVEAIAKFNANAR